jgi:hypothetical protein
MLERLSEERFLDEILLERDELRHGTSNRHGRSPTSALQ